MWRRIALTGALGITFSLVVAQPAWAPCLAVELPDVVEQADAVWWVTVLKATASTDGPADLTVRIDDVLKGPGEVGATAEATKDGQPCSLATIPITEKEASRLIGDQILLIGDVDDAGDLAAWPDVNEPQGMSPEAQYRGALAVLGLEDRDPPTWPRRDDPANEAVYALLVGLVAAAVVVLVARKRSASERGRGSADPPATT